MHTMLGFTQRQLGKGSWTQEGGSQEVLRKCEEILKALARKERPGSSTYEVVCPFRDPTSP